MTKGEHVTPYGSDSPNHTKASERLRPNLREPVVLSPTTVIVALRSIGPPSDRQLSWGPFMWYCARELDYGRMQALRTNQAQHLQRANTEANCHNGTVMSSLSSYMLRAGVEPTVFEAHRGELLPASTRVVMGQSNLTSHEVMVRSSNANYSGQSVYHGVTDQENQFEDWEILPGSPDSLSRYVLLRPHKTFQGQTIELPMLVPCLPNEEGTPYNAVTGFGHFNDRRFGLTSTFPAPQFTLVQANLVNVPFKLPS